MTAERWQWLRDRMPVTRDYAYMNSGWSGPLSTPVVDAMKARLDLELEHGPTTRRVMDDRIHLSERFREVTAQMLNADADEIAIMGNTTEGVNVAVNGIDFKPGDQVVISTTEHSSGVVPAYYLRERYGVEVVIVQCGADQSSGEALEAYASAIGAKTKLVILSEVSYSTGQLFPLGGIVEAAHRNSAYVLVDGAQTAGHIPIDMRASDVDFYAIPSHKWLCGPDGLGALYVRRERIPDLAPSKVAGRAAAQYDFEGGFTPEREKVTKYELTTISGALLAGTIAATEQYLESGVQAVFDRARELNRYAQSRFERINGVAVTSPRDDSTTTGLFCFSAAGLAPDRLSAFLQQEAKVVCRTVAQFNSVRLSLHCFNTEAEVDRAAEYVERALREGIPDEAAASGVAAEARADRLT